MTVILSNKFYSKSIHLKRKSLQSFKESSWYKFVVFIFKVATRFKVGDARNWTSPVPWNSSKQPVEEFCSNALVFESVKSSVRDFVYNDTITDSNFWCSIQNQSHCCNILLIDSSSFLGDKEENLEFSLNRTKLNDSKIFA